MQYLGTKPAVISNADKMVQFIDKSISLSHPDAVEYGKKIGAKDPARMLRELCYKNRIRKEGNLYSVK